MIGTFFGTLASRMTQATCHHEYMPAFKGKRMFLRCPKCNHETMGWDTSGTKPPSPRYTGAIERISAK